jgi:hypothetical protein
VPRPSHEASWKPPLSPAFAPVLAGTISTRTFGRLGQPGQVRELVVHDRWRADEPVQDRLIQHGDEVRGPDPVQDHLPVHPRCHQLLGPLVILTCRDEQRPRVLDRLEQARYQDRGPQAQRVRGAFRLEPALEPARYRPVGAPGERCPSSEQLPVQAAGLAPRV